MSDRRPTINLEARRGEPVTPVDVTVVSIEQTGRDPMSNTGSLPILAGVVAAIEGEKNVTIERTTAEQRRADLESQLYEIKTWWEGLTARDIADTLPKAIEYGASDLDLMGQGVRMLQGDVWEGGDAGERRAVGQELAILFYLQGKIARALSAASLGQRCSADTIKDIRIYAVMLQRVRETGTWVG